MSNIFIALRIEVIAERLKTRAKRERSDIGEGDETMVARVGDCLLRRRIRGALPFAGGG